MARAADDRSAPFTDRVIEVGGTVQGVGFRPFVVRRASALGLRGWVRNDAHGVTLRAAGPTLAVDRLQADMRQEGPPAARISAVRVRAAGEIPHLPPLPATGFDILESAPSATLPTVAVTPDLALCADCRREMEDPLDRRWRYPFINCTQCGPRYSIVRALPYDRPRTTMAEFQMCPACRAEYENPADRRYHAQPNACPVCGPRIELQDRTGRVLAGPANAISETAAALARGQIVAAKGIGGFHLLVDATNEAAVGELRRRKHRDEKPLAVMFASLAELRASAAVGAEEADWLTAAAAPIVLVRRRSGAPLAAAVAPGNPWLGAMLPHAPLQVLLLAAVGRPLVATSGNLS